VAVKDVKRMTIEILKGYEFGDPRSFVPVTYDNLKSWRRLEVQIAEIHEKGGVVDIPGYDCPYTEYDTKTRTYTRTPPPDSPAAIEAERRRTDPAPPTDDSSQDQPKTEPNDDPSLPYGIELPSHKRESWESLDVGRYGFPMNH